MTLVFLLVSSILLNPVYYTNSNYFYEITGKDSLVFGATNGGLVRYNRLRNTFDVITSTDGLLCNRNTSCSLDSSGYVWTGCDFGLAVISSDLTAVEIYPEQYLTSTVIHDIVAMPDSLYIGSASGLLFIDTRGTSVDFDDDVRLRLYQSNGLPSDNVTALAVSDTLVWVGTTGGLVHFNKDFSNPVQYTTSHGLLSNSIRSILIVDTSVYVATSNGLNRFSAGTFDTLFMGVDIQDMTGWGDSLVITLDSVSQVAVYYNNDTTIIRNGLPYRCPVRSLLVLGDELLGGLGNRYMRDYFGEGIGIFNSAVNTWDVYERSCLPSNHISEITVHSAGVFVACGARAGDSRGIGWLHDTGEWTHFSRDSLLPSNHIHRAVTAPDSTVWFGINAFSGQGSDTVMAFSFSPDAGAWRFLPVGYLGMEPTVAVWDLEFDHDNNLFLALSGPSDKLWVLDSSLSTAMFLGNEDISYGFNMEIAIDSSGNIWRTKTGDFGGIVVINTQNTLFDRNDDVLAEYGQSDGLLAKYAWGCVVDRRDVLYVANVVALLSRRQGQFSGISLSQDDHLDVELDTQGRVWVMARDGIYMYDPDLGASRGWRYASDLGVHMEFLDVTNEIIQVQGFAFDRLRNCFWLGGETGLLQIEVLFDTMPSLDSTLVYPNPVIGHGTVKIRSLPPDARVNIYSIAGRLIAEDLRPDNVFGEVRWDIPDDVASGLYFALIMTSQGEKVLTFAIVR
jgi:ligand-binding sensor domain-containing protein